MKTISIHQAHGIKSKITVPGDKSISHRALMLGALANGETIVNNFLPSADCLATAQCLCRLGVRVNVSRTQARVQGKGLRGLSQPKGVLDVGNSGTTIRLLSGILAGQTFTTKITGDESIQKRPMGRVAKPLREMGAEIEGIRRDEKGRGGTRKEGEIYPPLTISGGDLCPIRYELPVPSAQVKSAILLAGLFANGETAVIEKIPSRDHTERMLGHFGAAFSVAGRESRVTGCQEFEGTDVDVPGDLSSAAFFMVAGLLVPGSELRLLNVGVNPTRTGILDVLHRMGADIQVENERIISEEPRADIGVTSNQQPVTRMKRIKLDGEIIPKIIDEIPIIAVAATQAEGVTEIRGAKELRIKESDRIAAIASELRKMGAKIEELDDGLRITGPTKLKGAKVNSHGDHRIAMSLVIAGLIAEGETRIEDTECIETSFPGFEKILRSLTA